MKKHRAVDRLTRCAGITVCAVLLAGCGAAAAPRVVTEAPMPTDTMTALPSHTAPAVATRRAINTPTPPPATRRPTTATPGPSPTSPLAATVTDAPATLTATFAATLVGLRVEYFTTDTQNAAPGQNLTLFWSIQGAQSARLYRLDAEDERIWRWDVSPQGRLTVSSRADDREVARFLLEGVAARGATAEQRLLIPLRCTGEWFFEPAPETCPATLPRYSPQAEQVFERGRMVWSAVDDRIYVMFDDGRSPGWSQYPDNFIEGDPDRDGTLTPPEGLEQPVRGFGLVWREMPQVRERLGWAVSAEVGYEGAVQATSDELSTATVYLRTRDGGILALDVRRDRWEYLP
jgi:hypothetical protein